MADQLQLGYTIIYVQDVEATLQFYERAFQVPTKFLHPSKTYGELQTGSTTLAFAQDTFIEEQSIEFERNEAAKKAPGFEIAFVAQNVEEAFQRAVEQGAEILLGDDVHQRLAGAAHGDGACPSGPAG